MIQNPTYLPGEFIINYDLSRIGNGVYVDDNRLLASIKGKIVKEDGRMEIKDNLPEIRIGAIIVGKVMKIKEDKAFVSIIKVNCQILNSNLEGVLRKQNIRLHELDKLQMNECYIPGDIIRAKIISDRMYLSTAEDQLGVLFGKDEQGSLLIPLNWEEMISMESGQKYKRKVAKVDL